GAAANLGAEIPPELRDKITALRPASDAERESDSPAPQFQIPNSQFSILNPPSPIRLRPVLSVAEALEKVGQGLLCVVGEERAASVPLASGTEADRQQDAGGTLKIYGRCTTVAERAGHDRIHLV